MPGRKDVWGTRLREQGPCVLDRAAMTTNHPGFSGCWRVWNEGDTEERMGLYHRNKEVSKLETQRPRGPQPCLTQRSPSYTTPLRLDSPSTVSPSSGSPLNRSTPVPGRALGPAIC
jgi:hypothetical protein